MVNGNGNGGLTPLKSFGYSLTFTVALNTAVIWAINDLHNEMESRTQMRYTSADAEKDLRLRDFRMKTIEDQIQECKAKLREHTIDGHKETGIK